ncbi:MAG: hypothetical protein IT442_01400 [Phycisphaeraceae bacterium]|nr:hypothetical protein [Phycisphaeraceae bacterium]
MEAYDWTFSRGRKPAFDLVPARHRVRLFDVDYVHLRGLQSGDLFVTRSGWPLIECLVPGRWFVGERFSRVGRALAGATGAVYRVPVEHPRDDDFALVVKFCRFGQDALVTSVDPTVIADPVLRQRFAGAEFLSPFEEFGNLMRLRQAAGSRIRTKRPLAIFSPATRHLDWELGRKPYLQHMYSARLLASQAHLPPDQRLDYSWERIYVLLYHWIDGLDAVEAAKQGLLDAAQVERLTVLTRDTLLGAGWVVLDHKPRHVIVRPSSCGPGALTRHDQVVWAIVDYELLMPAGFDASTQASALVPASS